MMNNPEEDARQAFSQINSVEPLVQVYHLPKCFSRRHGEFTANICGAIAPQVKQVKYQLNQDQWLNLGRGGPRVPPPNFVIELRAKDLRRGTNYLKIEAIPDLGHPQITSLQFEYNPSSIKLPIKVDWSGADLDVQDGRWETILVNGEWRVRPKPGTEDYDRILAVTGAFPEGSRIETSITFRHGHQERLHGFGILPMWGGHSDEIGISPRRGWNYSIAWFYSRYQGIGVEFSYKHGDTLFNSVSFQLKDYRNFKVKDGVRYFLGRFSSDRYDNTLPKTISSYRSFEIKNDVRYFITVECWPELNVGRNQPRYRQRLKWQTEGEQASDEWIELNSTEGIPLPPGEYAVALVAHRSQAEFGPITVMPL